jgi:hypothetical protein
MHVIIEIEGPFTSCDKIMKFIRGFCKSRSKFEVFRVACGQKQGCLRRTENILSLINPFLSTHKQNIIGAALGHK